MEQKNNTDFIRKRMKEFREMNDLTQEYMASKLASNKSTISRIESGKISDKTILSFAKQYCEVFKFSEEQTEQFLRGNKIVIPDTSALLKNIQLIDELSREYNKVIIPKIIIDELDNIKNRANSTKKRKAWEILCDICYNERVISAEYTGSNLNNNNDYKIIEIARETALKYNCNVDIITDDIDYSAYLKSDTFVNAIQLKDYMTKKQSFINMNSLMELKHYYADNYDNLELIDKTIINAYLPDGNTLIISTVRDKKHSLAQKKSKILWLIKNGADIDKCDCNRRYFPPISHSIQINDFDMFKFLLEKCGANPNIGSRNPYNSKKLRQKNEGNMPLMIAAWHGREEFVKVLCNDNRTSINQQDANGFTALIKACHLGFVNCKDILIKAGADKKIVDINGKNFEDHYNDYLKNRKDKI